jgi:hypothetical protein
MRRNCLALLPRRVPALSILLDDIGNPDPAAIAKTLGVSLSTVYRWKAKDTAPRAVLLALYYATQWGRSDVNCHAVNDARLYSGYAGVLRTELDAANAKLARLGQIGDFGSANDPAPGAPAGAPQSTVVTHAGQPLETVEKPEEPARLTRAN